MAGPFKDNKLKESTVTEKEKSNDAPTIDLTQEATASASKDKSSLTRITKADRQSKFSCLIILSNNTVKCSVCERKKEKGNEWATCKILPDWHNGNFTKHEISKQHVESLRVEPMQNEFLVAVSTAYKKAESQTVGL